MPDIGALGSGLLTGLREGVEAALIVSIVLAYLARTGNRARFGAVWAGTVGAILLSILLGVAIFVTIGEFGSPYEQLFESGTMLIAAAIVTGMLFWMRREAGAVRGKLIQRVDQAIGEGGVLSLSLLAFTAVIREGIETSVFLVGQVQAAASSGGQLLVLLGAVVGLLLAAALGVGFYHGSRRINLGVFFRWTGIGLIFVAAGLVSRGLHELIEIDVIRFGTAPVFDLRGLMPDETGIGAILHAILGYSAAPEALVLAAYLAYLATVLVLYLRPVRPVTLRVAHVPGTGDGAARNEPPSAAA